MKKFFANMVLLAASLLLALLLAETILSALHLGRSRARDRWLLKRDPVLGWSLRPGVTAPSTGAEYSTLVSINSKGTRGPEFPYEKPPDTRRILVLGDSYVEGYTVDFEQTFHQVLASELGKPSQVISEGVIGYGTDQELLVYLREGRRYSPDIVVLQFFFNDVMFNALRSDYDGRAIKPLFRLKSDGSLDPKPALPVIGPIQSWLGDHSRVYELLHEVRRAANKMAAPLDTSAYRVWKTTSDPEVDNAWRLTEALLKEVDKEVSASGGRLVIFNAPHWATVYGPSFGLEYTFYGGYLAGLDPNLPAARLRAFCEKYGIVLVDPTEEMRAIAKTSDKPLYFKQDGHWTAEGHRAAGKILARDLSNIL